MPEPKALNEVIKKEIQSRIFILDAIAQSEVGETFKCLNNEFIGL